MVKIRLKQTGKKNDRKYRIVVTDARNKRDGKVLENLGHYNPRPDKSKFELDTAAAEKWIKNGAIMTERVAKIYNLVKNGKVE